MTFMKILIPFTKSYMSIVGNQAYRLSKNYLVIAMMQLLIIANV